VNLIDQDTGKKYKLIEDYTDSNTLLVGPVETPGWKVDMAKLDNGGAEYDYIIKTFLNCPPEAAQAVREAIEALMEYIHDQDKTTQGTPYIKKAADAFNAIWALQGVKGEA
jgi:hypothetical protein